MGVPGRTNRTQDLQPILLYIIYYTQLFSASYGSSCVKGENIA